MDTKSVKKLFQFAVKTIDDASIYILNFVSLARRNSRTQNVSHELEWLRRILASTLYNSVTEGQNWP